MPCPVGGHDVLSHWHTFKEQRKIVTELIMTRGGCQVDSQKGIW